MYKVIILWEDNTTSEEEVAAKSKKEALTKVMDDLGKLIDHAAKFTALKLK